MVASAGGRKGGGSGVQSVGAGGGGGSAQTASGSDQVFKNAGVNTAVLSQVSSGSSRSADAAAIEEMMKITVDNGTPYRTMNGLFDRVGPPDSKSAQKRVNTALAQAKAQGAPPAAVRVLRQVGANEIRRLRAAEQADRKQARADQAAYKRLWLNLIRHAPSPSAHLGIRRMKPGKGNGTGHH